MKNAVFNMEPFSCPSCVKKIETALRKVAGVVEAKVLFHAGRIRIEFDSAATSAEVLEGVVTRLGYPVLSKKVS
ncbi:heavy-metal-associated domain-containing protein [Alcaligenaceae bacterium]|nr:heavy-metal-associated domain-containing protein [Alcaligenaceae bacterium]